MFGIFRLYLALCVVLGHLGGQIGHMAASYALYGFFMLSGYLITMVCNRRYGFTAKGFLYFTVNRFLKIFPIYWLACAVSICLIAIFSVEIFSFHHPLQFPSNLYDWFRNITLIGYNTGLDARFVPPAWALNVELFFYLIIGLGMGRKQFALPWFGLAIAYHIGALVIGADRYYSFLSAALPFSMGAVLYHYEVSYFDRWRQKIMNCIGGRAIIFLLIAIHIVFIAAKLVIWGYADYTWTIFYYLNIIILFVSFYILKAINKTDISHLDGFAGGLSYPVYVLHYQVGFLVAYIFGLSKSLELFCATLGPLLLIVWCVDLLNRQTIEKVRKIIKINAG